MSLDRDIVMALYAERRRAIIGLIVRRARQEWKRLTRDGKTPKVWAITDAVTGSTHWFLEEGLCHSDEMAACGEEVWRPLRQKDEDEDGHNDLAQHPVTCQKCLKLLRRVGGAAVVEMAKSVAEEEGEPNYTTADDAPAPDATPDERPAPPRGGYF
jgi:hypothetical protein